MSAYLYRHPPSGLGTEEKLAYLTKQIANLYQQVGTLRGELTAHAKQYEADRKADRSKWQAAVKANEERVKNLMTGNLHIEVAGLAMFVAGLIVATFGPEFPGLDVCRQALLLRWRATQAD